MSVPTAILNPAVAEEWRQLETTYPSAEHKLDPERVQIDLDLVPGQYDRERVEVAVIIPVGYRATGPDGFLVPAGLSLSSGAGLPVSDAAGIGMPNWWMVSFHLVDDAGTSTWRPSASPGMGDNLVSYFGSIEFFLARGCN